MSKIKSYRNFKRERLRELDQLTKGIKVTEDREFESLCNSYLSGGITLNRIDEYLFRNLFLNVNESYFDESGDLIDYESINESWLKDLISKGKDGFKEKFNIAMSFFKAIVGKTKILIKSLGKTLTDPQKMMDILTLFFEKIMSGLKFFGNLIKKNKKGLYTILVKISVSLGITATVSYILSLFGPGWVVAMGAKTGTSAVTQKLKVGDKIASKIVQPKTEKKINDFLKFVNESEEKPESESKVKKVAITLGQGIIKFFKVLRKFKIAILIFLGAIWIIGHMFSPFGNFLDPIFQATQMTKLSDVFDHDFSLSASNIPPVKIDTSKIEEITTNKIQLVTFKDDENLGINEIQTSSADHLNNNVSSIKSEITKHPKEFCQAQEKLINDLRNQLSGDEKGINGVEVNNAGEISQEQIEKTTGENIEKLAGQEFLDTKELIHGLHKIGELDDSPEEIWRNEHLDEINSLIQDKQWSKLREYMIDNNQWIKSEDGQICDKVSGEIFGFPDQSSSKVPSMGGSSLDYDSLTIFAPAADIDNETILVESGELNGFSDLIFSTDTEGIHKGKTIMIFSLTLNGEGHEILYLGGKLQEGKFEVSTEDVKKLISKLHPEKLDKFNEMIKQG